MREETPGGARRTCQFHRWCKVSLILSSCVFVTTEMCLSVIEYIHCLDVAQRRSCHSLFLVLCYSCLRLVQFNIGRERVMCELLVGLNLGSSLG